MRELFQPKPPKKIKPLTSISKISWNPRQGENLGNHEIRGAQVRELLGDPPRLDNTCSSTDLPQEIRPKSQPNRTNENSPKINPKMPKKKNAIEDEATEHEIEFV